MTINLPQVRARLVRAVLGVIAGLVTLFGLSAPIIAQITALADKPIFAGADVPGNLALALSVEFPTAISVANIGNYVDSSTSYLGYFDPAKCYSYNYNSGAPSSSYFQPAAMASGTNGHTCSGYWSGNFMNWATMQTIDPFRWALSGGYRNVDTPTQTILEKAWGSQQGSAGSNFNYRGTSQGTPNNLPSASVAGVTPFTSWNSINMGIWGNGNMMVFSGTGSGYTNQASSAAVTDLMSSPPNLDPTGTYRVYIRVDVCDVASLGVAGLEGNCVKYGNNYKPEGLMQQYSNKIRFSAFSYLTQGGNVRQGGVLREPMGFIGPTYPQPLSATVITNTRPEWSAIDGTMTQNPDPATALAGGGVSQSGVLNYLNKFGETSQNYMTYDNVSELYYAALRYYENLGNVPEWTNNDASYLDGFPALTAWQDPIAYSCQNNFILGIGDDHTWYDTNVGGGSVTAGGRAIPSTVSSDSLNQASTWTTQLQALEGISNNAFWPSGATGSTYYIAGLAYGAHVTDIRPDLSGTQTISTFWMDVEENGAPEYENPYDLATKFGGFDLTLPTPPATYNLTTPLTQSQWNTGGASFIARNGRTELQPINYFLAGNANGMVQGLKTAFAKILSASAASSTAFSFSAPNVTSSSNTESFGASYNPVGWTGTVTGSTITFDSSGNPLLVPLWSTNTTLQSQLGGTGWQTARRVVTWNGSSGAPFELASLTPTQLLALAVGLLPGTYSPATTTLQYLNYLRGDQRNEVASTATPSTKSLRNRALFLGDIVNASVTSVTTPLQTFSEASNVGYAAFKTYWTTTSPRPTMVYAGANDGMLHGFLGSSGTEQFAYVPNAVFLGPNGTPLVDGLAQLGNPSYTHHFYVDATPINYDIDLNHTNGVTPTTQGATNWATLLIGGLGKGGKSFYAIDVTDPASMTTEAIAAQKVKWEFSDPTMGYSYGAPVVVKTAKYGWVVALTSGYDNSDGYGYLYLVNPNTGALYEPPIKTPLPSAGLTQASAFVRDYSDDTADSIYVGDLNGQVWRFDLSTPASPTANYPAPTLIALLTDAGGKAQPVTTAPLIEIHPVTRKRYIMVGTGQLLATSDITSNSGQSFYVIIDGTAGGFLAVPTPITRANLTPVTAANLAGGVTVPATSKGWYTDLGVDSTSGIAYRIVVNPQAYNGIVAFTDVLTSGNACSPSGQSRVYAVNYATVESVLQPSPTPFVSYTNDVVNIRFAGNNGSAELVVGFTNLGSTPQQVPATLSGVVGTRLLNWRELPTAN